MKWIRVGLLITASLLALACATSFTGSPYVENGRSGCEAKCRAAGMEVAGLVYMGEYSDACVCAVPGRSARAPLLMHATGAIAAAGAGVMMQMERNRRQQQQTMMMH